MAKFRQLNTEFWNDPYVASLPTDTRYLYLYLKLNEHITTAGCCELPAALMSVESGLSHDDVLKAIARLEADGKIKFDGTWLAVLNGNDGLTSSSKVKTAIDRQLAEAPSWVRRFIVRGHERDDRVDHPAIIAVNCLTERYPRKELWDTIIEALGEDFDMDLLMDAHSEWSRRGYSPLNYDWIFEWYANGKVPYRWGKTTNSDTLSTYGEVFGS